MSRRTITLELKASISSRTARSRSAYTSEAVHAVLWLITTRYEPDFEVDRKKGGGRRLDGLLT